MLEAAGLGLSAGNRELVRALDLALAPGQFWALLGRNGAGRTTTLKSILGLVGRRSGSIMVNGVEAVALAPHRIARRRMVSSSSLAAVPALSGVLASVSASLRKRSVTVLVSPSSRARPARNARSFSLVAPSAPHTHTASS